MSKADINLQQAFYMEPEEIVNYFKSKDCKISFDWHEVYEDAHAKAFTVAKMTQIDLLNDTQNMLATAIKEGWSEGHFQKEAAKLFDKKGWTGKKEVVNPKTGEVQTVELGTPRRIKKIFNCNMQSAYAVGNYKSLMENVDIAPYFQYVCILDGRTRPEHQAMHGKVFRYDDPIWNSIYPPNGWNCRCFVIQLSKHDIKKRGLTVESSEGHLRDIEVPVGASEQSAKGGAEEASTVGTFNASEAKVNKKTVTAYDFAVKGKKMTLVPDAGWSTNLGKTSYLDDIFWARTENLNPKAKEYFINEIAKAKGKTPEQIEKIISYKTAQKGIAKKIGLTTEEFFMVQEYTDKSTAINKAMMIIDKEPEKISNKIKKDIKILKDLLDKQSLDEQTTVFRGEGFGIFNQLPNCQEVFQAMKKKDIDSVKDLLSSEKLTQNRFMSTSTDINSAINYANKSSEPRILWTYSMKKGTKALKIQEISSEIHEKEILTQCKSIIEISNVKYDAKMNAWKIDADIITN